MWDESRSLEEKNNQVCLWLICHFCNPLTILFHCPPTLTHPTCEILFPQIPSDLQLQTSACSYTSAQTLLGLPPVLTAGCSLFPAPDFALITVHQQCHCCCPSACRCLFLQKQNWQGFKTPAMSCNYQRFACKSSWGWRRGCIRDEQTLQ